MPTYASRTGTAEDGQQKGFAVDPVPVYGDADTAVEWVNALHGGVAGLPMSGAGSADLPAALHDGASDYPDWFCRLVRAMLRWDPNRRPGLFDVRRCMWREEAWTGVGVGIADAEHEVSCALGGTGGA